MSGKTKKDLPRSQGPKPNDCSFIDINVRLYSPNPFVVAKLKNGDDLIIDYKEPSGPLVVKTEDDEEVGSILGIETHELVTCIKKGFKFIGSVKGIDGGNCTVNIKSL